MATFAYFECADPSCRLRFPLDTERHRGKFCPRCGGTLTQFPSLTDLSQAKTDRAIPGRKISVVLDNIRSAFNVGGIFRAADGVGVEHLYLCGITPTPRANPDMAKTALGAEDTISWSYHENAISVAEILLKQGVLLLALERTPGSIPIQDFPMDRLDKRSIALIVGHERAGVDPGLLALSNGVIALPMGGAKASLNVTVAFGVAVYWLSFH